MHLFSAKIQFGLQLRGSPCAPISISSMQLLQILQFARVQIDRSKAHAEACCSWPNWVCCSGIRVAVRLISGKDAKRGERAVGGGFLVSLRGGRGNLILSRSATASSPHSRRRRRQLHGRQREAVERVSGAAHAHSHSYTHTISGSRAKVKRAYKGPAEPPTSPVPSAICE
jgi:hypothetical protein